MVFWATALSFIVGIMLALIYPRNDRHLVENVPLAESFVAAFVAQHQAARDYANAISLALPYIDTPIGRDVANNNATFDPLANNIHVFQETFNNDFMPTISPIDGHTAPSYNVFPSGDTPRDRVSGETFGYTSALICLNKVDDPEIEIITDIKDGERVDSTQKTWDYGEIISCKTTSLNTFKYVLTYGLLFQDEGEDRNVAFHNKRLLWEKALTNRVKNTVDCGFIDFDEGTSNDEPRIVTLNGEGRKIPKAIHDFFYEDYLKKYENFQPLFCITPINTPYVTDGLLYHFDSTINQIDGGMTLAHRTSKTGWTNIVTQSDVGFTTTSTNADPWHPNNLQPLGLRGEHSLSLNMVDATTMQNMLGNTFTLSFVLRFITNDGNNIIEEMPLFGSPENEIYPRVSAFYDKGILTVSLRENNWRNYGEFNTGIQNSIVSITYVVTSRSHSLYINGELVGSETYPNEAWLTGIATPNLSIGGDASTLSRLFADLYNIKIYNRALNRKEIQYNFNTDRKRFKF